VLLGSGKKQPNEAELAVAKIVRRSVVAARDLKTGDTITSEMVLLRRPGTGIEPARMGEVIGRTLSREVKEGVLLSWDDLA